MATGPTIPPLEIRPAVARDAGAICAVVRDSIITLCGADHQDDPEILGAWLANKTPETVERWIASPANAIFVAVDAGAVVAAACVTPGGEILLNYVSPTARFRGASKALMRALEDYAQSRGNARCTLDSTATAHDFYRSLGYTANGEPSRKHGVGCYPMVKAL